MQAQRATIRFMADYQAIWFRNFPDLARRGQWHIVSHLCSRARDGSTVGALSGVVKQLFLLDDATVRERLNELCRLGLCAADPPGRPVAARTIIVPTETLLRRFDLHLAELAQALFAAVQDIAPDSVGAPLDRLDDMRRRALLRAVEGCNERCLAALEQGFAAAGMSTARRLEARRHLAGPSHWLLLQMALERHYDALLQADDGKGVLADDLAAELLRLLRQNFQTTRDHIAYLMKLGLLERRPGRALRVALAEAPAVDLRRALADAAKLLVEIARVVAPQDDLSDRAGAATTPPAGHADGAQHVLTISRTGEPDRRMVLGPETLVIGRAPSSGLQLASNEVSRAHCQIEMLQGHMVLTDLDSTNGTFVDGGRVSGSAELEPGAVVQVGPYRMRYAADGAEDSVERTMRIVVREGGKVTPLRLRRPR